MADTEASLGAAAARVFISHKHSDKRIAEAIATFIKRTTANQVVVFDSSSSAFESPRMGKNVNTELKEALARSFGANTLQIFTKIRIPMAMPMIIVGLMVGSIFGLLTAVGADMVGGAAGLGNRLTYYSSLIRMPQFFAIILILAAIGISIYVFFFWLGKRWASWEA